MVELEPSGESVVVMGLHPGVEYVFTVVAVNDIGDSLPSEPEAATTLEEGEQRVFNFPNIFQCFLVFAVPSDSPQMVTAMAVSSTEILVMWEEVPEADRNGVIEVYEVLYVPLETCDGLTMPGTVNITNISTLFTTLTGLQEYVEYNISVRAYTSVGPGPYSDGVVERTEEDGKGSYTRVK